MSPHLLSRPPPSRPGSSRVWWLGGENSCFWMVVEGGGLQQIAESRARAAAGGEARRRRGKAPARQGPAAARIALPACCESRPSVRSPVRPARERLSCLHAHTHTHHTCSVHTLVRTLLPRLQNCCANRCVLRVCVVSALSARVIHSSLACSMRCMLAPGAGGKCWRSRWDWPPRRSRGRDLQDWCMCPS